MELLEHDQCVTARSGCGPEQGERAARRSLRAQIDKLERELADAFVTAYPMGGLERVEPAAIARRRRGCSTSASSSAFATSSRRRVRGRARTSIAERADVQAANRVRLEKMLLDPGRYRFVRIANRDIGEPGCGVWHVRPRLGLIGMLMGWWEVKLSSGCPLAAAAVRRGSEARRRSSRSKLTVRDLLRTGAGATLVLLIMVIGSLVLWIGTPLLWLWVGSQVQGATSSLGTALGVSFIGVVATIGLLAAVLAKLSDVYQANRRARGLADTGHYVLETVLVVSAGLTLAAFVVWFFFFAGASPVPVGIQI